MEKTSLSLSEMLAIAAACQRKRDKEKTFLRLLGIELEEVSEEELLLRAERLPREEREFLELSDG